MKLNIRLWTFFLAAFIVSPLYMKAELQERSNALIRATFSKNTEKSSVWVNAMNLAFDKVKTSEMTKEQKDLFVRDLQYFLELVRNQEEPSVEVLSKKIVSALKLSLERDLIYSKICTTQQLNVLNQYSSEYISYSCDKMKEVLEHVKDIRIAFNLRPSLKVILKQCKVNNSHRPIALFDDLLYNDPFINKNYINLVAFSAFCRHIRINCYNDLQIISNVFMIKYTYIENMSMKDQEVFKQIISKMIEEWENGTTKHKVDEWFKKRIINGTFFFDTDPQSLVKILEYRIGEDTVRKNICQPFEKK